MTTTKFLLTVYNYSKPKPYKGLFSSLGGQRRCFQGRSLSFQKSSQDGKDLPVIDGLEASTRWKRDQLNSISDKFLGDSQIKVADEKSQRQQQQPQQQRQPLQITNDDEVQPMWRDMESRVLRRKSVTMAEALTKGMKIGRRNIRNTDEDVWLDAGLYHNHNENTNSEK
jgi:hypothetical protein